MDDALTAEEQRLVELWEAHLRWEFESRDASATVATMSPSAYVNHVPVMTGGSGREALLEFYSQLFIPKMPDGTEIALVERTLGQGRIVDEMIFRFTHDRVMDWMLPGIQPTGRRVEIPMVVVVQVRDDQIACERIYWDQASVLAQLGLLDATCLPVAGRESAAKVLDPSLPSNELIARAHKRVTKP